MACPLMFANDSTGFQIPNGAKKTKNPKAQGLSENSLLC